MFEVGLEDALTGPLERSDIETIKNHLSSLSDDKDCKGLDEDSLVRIEKIYRLLSLDLLEVAQKKHPDRNYSDIEDLLKKD